MIYAKLAGALGIISIIAAGYFYVKGLQDDIVELSVANAKYSIAVDELKFSLEGIMDGIESNELRLKKLYKTTSENSVQVKTFSKKLSKHDLTKIVQRKPKLFEKIAQKGTIEYYKTLQETTKWKN